MIAVGCASSVRPSAIPAPLSSSGPSELVQEAPELTSDEKTLKKALERHLGHLSEKIGERNPKQLWELAETADYIAAELEGMGYPLERQGYETEEVAAQNIAVTVPGGMRGDEVLLVGAHYDSPAGSRGVNAGASGTAALLELARIMRGAQLTRSLRFVFFAMGESPHGDDEARGARHFARKLKEESQRTSTQEAALSGLNVSQRVTMGLIQLDRLGSFRGASATSLRSPQSRGSVVVRLTVSPGAELLRSSIADALTGDHVRVQEALFAPFVASQADSDVAAFFEQGIKGISVSGDGASAESVKDLDTTETARIVMRLRRGIGQIVGEKMINDAMLTPSGVGMR